MIPAASLSSSGRLLTSASKAISLALFFNGRVLLTDQRKNVRGVAISTRKPLNLQKAAPSFSLPLPFSRRRVSYKSGILSFDGWKVFAFPGSPPIL
ncbi:hypothetical protein HHK36_015389 [Tetracentron sinense]|uniref:Uncharacterized protein n=1 Tax=Tetracentron sinense TaxID=13715 RepID=A0A835DDL2_TETSI|nr:hypothetical protein HHK36_015389 [Tetracentron sinense]